MVWLYGRFDNLKKIRMALISSSVVCIHVNTLKIIGCNKISVEKMKIVLISFEWQDLQLNFLQLFLQLQGMYIMF